MARRAKKAQVRKSKVLDLLSSRSSVEELKDEMVEWKENMEGAGMENVPKFEEVSDAADALEQAVERLDTGCEDLEKIENEELKSLLDREVEYTYHKPLGRRTSRQDRLSDAYQEIERGFNEVKAALEDETLTTLTKDQKKELEDALSEIEDGLGECDAVSFPGMY